MFVGSRRVRGGSMRGGGQSSHHEGPSLEDLAKAGVRVEVLQQLMPPGLEGNGLTKLLPLDQVTMKGEDLSGELYTELYSALIVDRPCMTTYIYTFRAHIRSVSHGPC